MDERKLIEEAYAAGVLCLLCCTSTLAAGVNLPAKRVIIRSPYVGNQFMLRSQYKQMIGRAGRAGIDSSGESVLIVQKKDREKCKKLLDGPIGVCKSSLLYEKGKGLRHLILSLLGLKVCTSVGSLEDFLKSTLYYVQLDAEDRDKLSEMVQREYDQLVLLKMVTNEEVVLTSLGHATYKGCMDVDRAPFVYSQLQHSLQGMVLRDELHLLYLATPLDQVEGLFVKWMIYYNQVIKLDEVAIKAAHFIGVTENMLSKKATGKRCNKESFNEFVYKRFFLTLLLFELTKGRSVLQVSETYEVQRGFVQNLLSSAISFTYMLVQFTGELSEFWTLKLLFQALLERLSNTNNLELAPLMELPGVKLVRARQLFKSGYHTLQQLAVADPETLIASIEHMPRKQATLIVASAKMILQEKVEALREKADEMDIEVA